MSMKRTKQKGAGREKDQVTDFWAKPVIPEKTWDEHVGEKPEDEFTAYAMSASFKKGQLVLHPKFGKGVVTDVETTGRIEIMFQDGKKKLGHGQS